MASLISDSEKTTLNSALEDQADTFSRDLICYKDAKQTVTAPSESFNSIYGNAGATTSITYTPQSITVQARIQYAKNYNEEQFTDVESDSQLKLEIPNGKVRIKIKSSDFAQVKDCKRFKFDGSMFYKDSDFRGHGLFDVQYYTFLVKPTD